MKGVPEPSAFLSSSFPASFDYKLPNLPHIVVHYTNETQEWSEAALLMQSGQLKLVKLIHHTRGKWKPLLFCNPAVIARSTKVPGRHGVAPLERSARRKTFQTVPSSQNNAVTHKYHLPPVNKSEYQIQSAELHPLTFYFYCILGRIPALYVYIFSLPSTESQHSCNREIPFVCPCWVELDF